MNITKSQEDTSLIISVEGRLDAQTSPVLQDEIAACLDQIEKLTLDLENVDYVSSAGLRVIIWTQKAMNSKNGLILKKVCPAVMDVFNMTGFSNILTFE
ncbi:MAG: STAS domain-containing protein [Coriobacteriales bacterium]|nr:STAS domain-containing protein [Coriobacteriales bacterium]